MTAQNKPKLKHLRIKGFRSLQDFEMKDIGDLTVLLGGNGSGKSNIIYFFKMLSWMLRGERLVDFIGEAGGADDQLFGGRRVTPKMEADIGLEIDLPQGGKGLNEYRFSLAHAQPNKFFFTEESFRYSKLLPKGARNKENDWIELPGGANEAAINRAAHSDDYPDVKKTATVVAALLKSCSAFQFHDTSKNAHLKSDWSIDDCQWLKDDGRNLAPILYRLQQEDIKRFDFICQQISRILPPFKRFILEPQGGKVLLQWSANWTDKTFGPHLTSDGSLRFFALVVLLNLPGEMLPSVILLDEPELGLHPAAVTVIAAMIKQISRGRQVILATQSPQFINELGLDSITTLDLVDGETKTRRINQDEFKLWLDDGFSPGDLWMKNLLGGRP